MYTYYNENIPRSVSSVDVATKRGIIPFGYNNPKIRYLNALFALAFWTGNISQGLVNTKPCDTNEGIVKDVLDKLGYKKREDNSGKRGLASTDPKKEDGKYAIPKPQNYQLCCSAASRSFGILGLPYREGRKASNKDFRIPWYALFMSGLLEEGQKFDDRSVGYSQEFQKIFIYALLSDKTNVGGDTVLVNLMGSHSENIGKGLTGTTSRILMNVFPGVQISEDNQITTEQVFKGRDDYNFRNTIYIEDKNWMPFIDTLEKDSGQSFDPKEPSYMEVRRLSGIALRGLVFKKD
ncbi:hypothetical protein KY366_04750 [Candidatus Woesearchaeota archaeon]|nr:hypothetical protein [Candidatus Woesearchaeota archaeon]